MMEKFINLDRWLGLMLVDGAKLMFWIFGSVAILICLVYQLQAIPFQYSLDYGEAPLVDQAMRLAAGGNIYREDISTPPYTISNYPPVYVSLLAIGVKLLGPAGTFQIGRIISVLSAWVCSACLGLLVYRVTRDRFAGLGAGAVFLAFPYVVFWSGLARIDLLALAFSLAGLCVLSWKPASLGRLLGAGLLLIAAIFTRQSYALAAPLGGFVWLLAPKWQDGGMDQVLGKQNIGRAIWLTGMVGGGCLILFLVLNGLTKGGFFFNIVTANVNEFGLGRLAYNWEKLRDASLLLLILGCFSLFLIRRWNPLWALAAPYLVGAALSALTIGKIGSNVNYFLELCAALSLAAGAVIAWSRRLVVPRSMQAVVLVMLALGLGRMMHVTLNDYTVHLNGRRAELKELGELATLVADAPGPILADEYMGMLTIAGHPLVIQPFEVTQLAQAGIWDQTGLLKSIQDREYAYIIIYDQPWANERWTKEVLSSINRNYRLVKILAGNKVFRADPP